LDRFRSHEWRRLTRSPARRYVADEKVTRLSPVYFGQSLLAKKEAGQRHATRLGQAELLA
jgi:hypothetical protein